MTPNAPASGSGLSAHSVIPGIPSGDVDLIAPLGTIDADEAGIRGNNVSLAALHIVNAANIQVQGRVTGVPQVQAPNIGVDRGFQHGSGRSSSGCRAEGEGNAQPSIIIVEVLGVGGERETDSNRTKTIPERERADLYG